VRHTTKDHGSSLCERLADLLGGWTTLHCPAPSCSLQIRFRRAGDASRCRELLADHARRCHAA
jgi:hypothetical protein